MCLRDGVQSWFMDLLIRLIEWLVRSLLNENDRTQSATPPEPSPSMPSSLRAQVQQRAQTGTAALQQQRSQPLVTSTKAATRDPLYDDGSWRRVVTALAVAALLILVLLWAVYVARF